MIRRVRRVVRRQSTCTHPSSDRTFPLHRFGGWATVCLRCGATLAVDPYGLPPAQAVKR